jgi:hypothetical protein
MSSHDGSALIAIRIDGQWLIPDKNTPTLIGRADVIRGACVRTVSTTSPLAIENG